MITTRSYSPVSLTCPLTSLDWHSGQVRHQGQGDAWHLYMPDAIRQRLQRMASEDIDLAEILLTIAVKSKSYIALKEARESLYWIELLHRNGYLNETQFQSIHNDCEELVKVLVHRCKKIDEQSKEER